MPPTMRQGLTLTLTLSWATRRRLAAVVSGLPQGLQTG
jgi:hypothetical protein